MKEGTYDLDDIDSVKAELRTTVAATNRYASIDAVSRYDRLREYARIAFLASRLSWLESVEAHQESGIRLMPGAASVDGDRS